VQRVEEHPAENRAAFTEASKKHDSTGYFNPPWFQPRNSANNSAIAPSWGHAVGAKWSQFRVLPEDVMMFRTIVCCAALVLGLLPSLNVSAAPACDGAACEPMAKSKPLDIMQFMREQAASTRAVKPQHGNIRTTATTPRAARPKTTARTKPARLPAEAATSFATQPDPGVQVVAGEEFNAIDGTATAVPAETTGAAVATGPDVQLVDAEEFNDIDRKAAGGTSNDGRANPSWLQWIWSALSGTLTAVATAVHHLIG
jgi:hypothetical protein